MAQRREKKIATRSIKRQMENDMPSCQCPIFEDEQFDEFTGEMEVAMQRDDYNYELHEMTWADWYIKYGEYLSDEDIYEWHKWCSENEDQNDEAKDYMTRVGPLVQVAPPPENALPHERQSRLTNQLRINMNDNDKF